MKKTFKTLAAALLLASALTAGFTACQDKLVADGTDNGNSGNDEYSIVLTRSDGTKATPADLGMRKTDGSHKFIATLYKNGDKVDNSLIDWSWDKSGNYFTHSVSDEAPWICEVIAVGHGTHEVQKGTGGGVWASAAISGKTVAVSEQADVNVTDNRDWVWKHPRTVNLYMRIRKSAYSTPISIIPTLSICDTDDYGDEKEVDMETYGDAYLSWSWSTKGHQQFDNCWDDCEDNWDYTDYSWLSKILSIEIQSEESRLNGSLYYSVKYGSYESSTKWYDGSWGLGGQDYIIMSEVADFDESASAVYDKLTDVSWNSISQDCFDIYVYLDLSGSIIFTE